MSRGRKSTSYKTSSNWEDIFWNCLPIYIGIIIKYFKMNGFEMIDISDSIEKLSFSIPKGLISKEIKAEGTYPVISQSKEYIIGYSDREDLLVKYDLPMIIFGDHSKTIKYVDMPFVIGADGVKLIKPKNIFNEKFFYYILNGIITDTKDYGRHFALLRKGQLPKIDRIELQKAIVNFLDDLKMNSLLIENTYFNKEIEDEIVLLQENQLKGNCLASEITNQLDLVKQLRQSFLREAMQGKLVQENPHDEPTSQLLKKIIAEKEKLVKEKKLKKEKELSPINESDIPFDIPNNWIWCKLGNICQKITDGFHNTPPKVSEGFPYIAATHVKSDKIDWENCHYVAENYHRELFFKAYPQKGELLVVNIGAGCGTPAIIDVNFEFSFKNTAILKFNQSFISNKLLFYYFLLRKDEIYINLTKGGLQPFLSLKILNDIYLPLPPYAEQERIVEKLDQLMKYCDELEASIKESKIYNEQLLHQVLKEALKG